MKNIEKHLRLTEEMAVPMAKYYNGECNKFEVMGVTASLLLEAMDTGKAPKETNFEGHMEWLNRMAVDSKDGLGLPSSGSYWTALWDFDYFMEDMEEEEYETWSKRIRESRYASYKANVK